MAIWKKYKKRMLAGSKAGSHGAAPSAAASSGAKPRADTGYIYYTLLGIWYLVIWPILSFDLFFALLEALTGCEPGNCSQIKTPLDDFSPDGLSFISFMILLLFLITVFEKFEGRWFLNILSRTHRYACLLTPSLVGVAGYTVPTPFLISLPYTAFYPKELPILLGLFFVTWMLFFIVFTTDRFFPRLWDRSHKDTPDGNESIKDRK